MRLNQRFRAALDDAAKHFGRPDAVLADKTLSDDEKRHLLKHWEYDLRALQVAADENMAGPGAGNTEELLREVRACLGKLGDSHAPERSASHKHGG
jgi:hypothetical protein